MIIWSTEPLNETSIGYRIHSSLLVRVYQGSPLPPEQYFATLTTDENELAYHRLSRATTTPDIGALAHFFLYRYDELPLLGVDLIENLHVFSEETGNRWKSLAMSNLIYMQTRSKNFVSEYHRNLLYALDRIKPR